MKVKKAKIAIIHEWITVIAGSEHCFKAFTQIFPEADIFVLVADKKSVEELGLSGRNVNTSFIQKLPWGTKKWRAYLPFFPIAVEQHDLSSYDLIISSSHAVAKGVIVNSNQLHISYVHSPIRYGWDLYHQYLKESGLHKGIKGLLAKTILHYIRLWDVNTHQRVDHFIANSNYIRRRIGRVYKREADVIYPPVKVDEFEFHDEKEDYYLAASRMVPYKRMDIIVEAFKQLPDKKLVVIGNGPDYEKVKKAAGDAKNIELIGYQPFESLCHHMQKARAFVFAAEEDFGIIPVEAQACGTPVIAYAKGGSCETVVDRKTGVYFYEQSSEAIVDAVNEFESTELNPQEIRKHAERFSEERYHHEILEYVKSRIEENKNSLNLEL